MSGRTISRAHYHMEASKELLVKVHGHLKEAMEHLQDEELDEEARIHKAHRTIEVARKFVIKAHDHHERALEHLEDELEADLDLEEDEDQARALDPYSTAPHPDREVLNPLSSAADDHDHARGLLDVTDYVAWAEQVSSLIAREVERGIRLAQGRMD
jgi:hypothetical protein